MAKKDQQLTEIDLQGWITQAEYARLHGQKLSRVSQWVKRAKEGKTAYIQYLDVPALGVTLVKPL